MFKWLGIFGRLYGSLRAGLMAASRRVRRVRWWRAQLTRLHWGQYLAAALLVAAVTVAYQHTELQRSYVLDVDARSLLGAPVIDAAQIKDTELSYTYNQDGGTGAKARSDAQIGAPAAVKASTTVAADGRSSGDKPYQAKLSRAGDGGLEFGDADGNLSFELLPQFGSAAGRRDGSRVIYPGPEGTQQVYTYMRNGIKEDILLRQAPGSGSLELSWRLKHGKDLAARMMPDGSVGLYSASPYLYGNLQVSDPKSQALVDAARQKGDKTNLAFILPAPYLKSLDGTRNYQDVSFTLNGDVLTLQARNLRSQTYPLSIDPSVAVTTNNDFRSGTDDGMIDYGTSGQMARANVSLGGNGTFAAATSFTTGREGLASVASNGYLYVIGGELGTTSTACKVGGAPTSLYCSDIQYAPILGNGTLGSFTANTNYLPTARSYHTAVITNGYMYVTAGDNGSNLSDTQYAAVAADGSVGTFSATSSLATARSSHAAVVANGFVYISGGNNGGTYYNDVQYAKIKAGGGLESFSSAGTFTAARQRHSSNAYNGYLYIMGGYHLTSDTACSTTANFYCNDIQYAPINADGTLGTFVANATDMPNPLSGHASVVGGGYLYVNGGSAGGASTDDVRYAPINANGSVGSFTTDSDVFTTARKRHAAVYYDGYLYVVGGLGGTQLTSIQYARIAQSPGPVGTVGAWSATTSFTTARFGHTSVAYNGYLYVIGGFSGSYQNDVQKAPINPDGTIGTWSATTSFTTARSSHASVAYNGYLYVIGGSNGTDQNDVQKAAIAADGTVGTWSTTTNFGSTRNGHAAVAYNGYLYVIGGHNGIYFNSVDKAPINPDGTIGTWATTTSFTTARRFHTSVAYNGYLYVIGGEHSTSDTACNGTASIYCSDVQKAAIAADGTIGTWATTTSFTTARQSHTSVAYNGYLYVIGGTNGTNQNDVQKAAIAADGTIGTWATTTSFTTARRFHTSVAYNGYLYVIGGWNGTTYYSDVQKAIIDTTAPSGTFGTAGTFSATTSFTNARNGHTSVAYNGYLYVIGGHDGTSYLATVQKAPIAADGTIGTWATTTSFTTARQGHTSVAYNGYLYVIGGYDGTNYLATAQKSAIAADGTIGTWSATTSFTTARFDHTSVAYNGYLYVIGGKSGTNTFQNDVQKAAINPDGTIGTWSATTSFTTARSAHTSVAYNGYLYVIGGSDSSSDTNCHSPSTVYCSDVQKAPINPDGTIGTWASTTSFTTARDGHTSVAYNGYLYVIGGYNGGTYYATVQKAPINADGTIGTWASTTSFTTARYGHTTITANGYLYVIGGFTGSYQSGVQKSALASMSQQASYEKIIDIGSVTAMIDDVKFSGSTACGARLSFRTAGSDGLFGAVTEVPFVLPARSYQVNAASKQYVWVKLILTDSECGTNSYATDITVNYTAVLSSSQATIDATAFNNGTDGPNRNGPTLVFTSDQTGYAFYTDLNQQCVYAKTSNGGTSWGSAVALDAQTDCLKVGVWYDRWTPGDTTGNLIHIAFSDSGSDDLWYLSMNTASSDALTTAVAISSSPGPVFANTLNENGNRHTITKATDGDIFIGVNDGSSTVTDTSWIVRCAATCTSAANWSSTGATLNVTTLTQESAQDELMLMPLPAGDILLTRFNNVSTLIDSAVYTSSWSGFTTLASGSQINNNSKYEGKLGLTLDKTTNDIYLMYMYDNQSLGTDDGIATAVYSGGAWTAKAFALSNESRGLTNGRIARDQTSGDIYVVYSAQATPGDTNPANIYYKKSTDGMLSWGAEQGPLNTSAADNYSVHTNIMSDERIYAMWDVNGGTTDGWYGNTVVNLSTGTNDAPAAPTLLAPSSGATNVSILPEFQLRTTDNDGDYLRYKIEVCSTSNCSSVVRTIDQTASQTGWSGQDTQTASAYVGSGAIGSSTIAIHTYQTAGLTTGTQYWWRAYAIDPGGSNTFGTASAIQSFTTTTGGGTEIKGNVEIRGGTIIGN